MTKDEQARAIVKASIAHLVANGPCENRPDVDYAQYCDNPNCTYCALDRAAEGYHAEG